MIICCNQSIIIMARRDACLLAYALICLNTKNTYCVHSFVKIKYFDIIIVFLLMCLKITMQQGTTALIRYLIEIVVHITIL